MSAESIKISSRGFYTVPREGKFDICFGCYFAELSPNCLSKIHYEIDNELPQCGREPIIYKHKNGGTYNGKK